MIKKICIVISSFLFLLILCSCNASKVKLKIMFVFSENPFFHSSPIGVIYEIKKYSKLTDEDYKKLLIESKQFRVNDNNIEEYYEEYRDDFCIYKDSKLDKKISLNHRFNKDTTIYLYMPVYFQPLLYDSSLLFTSYITVYKDLKATLLQEDLNKISSLNCFFDETIKNPFLVFQRDIGPLLYELSDEEYNNELLLEETVKNFTYQMYLELDKKHRIVEGTDISQLADQMRYFDQEDNEYAFPIHLTDDIRLIIRGKSYKK